MKLIGEYRVVKINRKSGAKGLKKLQVGDLIKVEFYINGNGGNSPMVKLHVNNEDIGYKYAREVNELFESGKKFAKWNGSSWEDLPPIAELEEVKQ